MTMTTTTATVVLVLAFVVSSSSSFGVCGNGDDLVLMLLMLILRGQTPEDPPPGASSLRVVQTPILHTYGIACHLGPNNCHFAFSAPGSQQLLGFGVPYTAHPSWQLMWLCCQIADPLLSLVVRIQLSA